MERVLDAIFTLTVILCGLKYLGVFTLLQLLLALSVTPLGLVQ
jgi:hypothetical protein